MPMISVKTDSAHLNRMTAHYHRSRARLDKLARDRRNDSPLHPQFVAATIDRLAAPDGGLTMLLGELITLRQLQLPVKVVVFNNGALSFVELEMKAAGIVTYGTDLDNPDFAAIAQAVGLFGARVEKAGELDDALRAAFGHDGPALVDVRTDRYELSLPPKLTFGQIKGFTLYATRTILSGEGQELVELTKTNLRD